MLPDFLVFKRMQAKLYARSAGAGGPLTQMIQKTAIHEGDGFVTMRADGSSSRAEMVQVSSRVEIATEAIRSGDQDAVMQSLSKLRGEVGSQQDRMLLDEVSAAADSVGNVTHAGGKPLTPEIVLEALSKLELQFKDDGTWDQPTWVLHPTMQEAAVRALERLHSEPALKRQLDELLEKGRTAWRDRESNRKLVD